MVMLAISAGTFYGGVVVGKQAQMRKASAFVVMSLIAGEAKKQSARTGHELYNAKLLDLWLQDLDDAHETWMPFKNDFKLSSKQRAEFAEVVKKSLAELNSNGEQTVTKEAAIDAILERAYGDE